MNDRLRIITNPSQLSEIREQILESIYKTVRWIRSMDEQPISLFELMRFRPVGHDPLTGTPLNIVEQLNQTFTILAALKATELLFEMHPQSGGYRLALGTCAGRDIESIEPGLIAAEIFCATHPRSNRKLDKDIARMAADTAQHRYVFYSSPGHTGKPLETTNESGVRVFAIDLNDRNNRSPG